MYRKSFPKCEMQGPLDPVEWGHMGSTKSIPRKCYDCSMLFEGECLRAMDQVQGYLKLDYGPCKRTGSCEPKIIENEFFQSKVYVPEKCVRCPFLECHSIFGFTCHEDEEIWGPYGKTLDWGHWSPELPNIGLKSRKLVSMELISAVQSGKQVDAIKIFRELNPGTNIKEGKEAYNELSNKLQSIS